MAAKPRQVYAQRPLPPDREKTFQPRKSLKQAMKDVFLRTMRRLPMVPVTVGSGILRRAEATAPYFPSTTTLAASASSRPGSQFTLDEYTISRSIPNRFQSPRHRALGRQSLLPATSLSQFNLNQAYLRPSMVSGHAVHDAATPSVESVLSQQASISSLSGLSTTPSFSSLRIQESCQSLVSSRASASLPTTPDRPPEKGQACHVSWLRSPTESSISIAETVLASGNCQQVNERASLSPVEHFKSFCILDTAVAGCPVVATSRELCYIFEIGEHFFLNNSECEGASMDIVTGQDAAGEPITHLVLFTPLVIPSSGRSRFMLACLVDVTRFISNTASLPELDQEFDTSTMSSELHTPLQDRRNHDWLGANIKLSADDLLGGCMLPSDRQATIKIPPHEQPEDIWLRLAKEEKSGRSSPRSTARSTPKISQAPRSNGSHTSATSSPVDDVLDEFMNGLQELYSEFFLLGKSPLDNTCFEICNVSPVVSQSKEYINGHLSRTDPQRMADLSAALAQGSPFNMPVKWGFQGVDKRLYCSPMYTATSITWICFLVDAQVPLLW